MKKILLISMLVISTLSCKKDVKDVKNGTDKTITGKITLKGVFLDDIADLCNVSVSLNDKYFAVTDSLGEFLFKNLPAGDYTMKIDCYGFEPLICIAFKYLANDTILPVEKDVFTLSKYPQIEIDTFTIAGDGYAIVRGRCLDGISNVTDPKLDIILLGDTLNTVDKYNFDYISPGYAMQDLEPDGSFHKEFSVSGIYGHNFPETVKKVYYRIYIASKGSVNNFLGTGCNVYICSKTGSDVVEYKLN
ncbi:MAG: hypothetical protein WCM93_09730 [Bacteroidota bacterium]